MKAFKRDMVAAEFDAKRDKLAVLRAKADKAEMAAVRAAIAANQE